MSNETKHHLLEAWAAWQHAQNLSDRTIDERAGTITQLLTFAQCEPEDLTADAIIRFCARPGLSPNTRATYHATVRAFCAWMVRTHVRADNPATDTPTPKRPRARPRPLSSIDVHRTITAATRPRTRAYILLAVLAGLRVHEIAKVHGHDIDHERQALIVAGKGGAVELIPLHDRLTELARVMPADDWWFPSPAQHDAPVTRYAVAAAISQAMRRGGVRATPHQLRHTYGTELLRSGADLRTVQELMRHVSVETTQRYTDTSWNAKENALRNLRLAG